MHTYLRHRVSGGTYFFTVNLAERKHNDYVQQRYPFVIEVMGVLPEHLHCLWTLPEDDDDFPLRWRLLKAYCSGTYAPRGTQTLRAAVVARRNEINQ